jgi:anaerobic magnesium-protoporphyrin IX monomethyl ester cyclase
MKHLVVVPRITLKVNDWYQFPMGIAYISAALKKAGFSIFTLNLNHLDGSVADLVREEVTKNDIDVVMTGGLTGQYGAMREVFEAAKATRPSIVTVAGGGLISSAPEPAMEALQFADYGVIGEGDIIICELCSALENRTPIEAVSGLVLKQNGRWFRTSCEVTPVDLDKLPLPDYEGLAIDNLLRSVPNIVGMSDYNTLPIITGRSCPYSCSFCFHPSGQKFRQRSLDEVFKEVDYLVERFGVQYLAIIDELFLFKKKISRVEEFCRRIRPYGIKWLAQFRVPDITEEIVEMLKDANCRTMAFGIESADNGILKSMNKKITIEQTERALDIVYRAGIGIQGVLIFGDIAETIESAKKTLEWWKKNIQYELQLSAVITYPGTKIYQYALETGRIADEVKFIKDGCPIVKLSDMSDDEYKWLFNQIAQLPRSLQKRPEYARCINVDFNTSHIDVHGYCASCGQENECKDIRLFIAETLSCRECGRKHISPIPIEILERIRLAMKNLIKSHKKVAFWGVNSYIFQLLEESEEDWGREVYHVDKSEARIGLKIGKRTISDPIVITEQNIECVVVMVVQYYAGLINPIRNEFPNVKVIYSIADLLSDSICHPDA